ncbi:MAG: hypothetical protein MI923_22900 [Phycisphaerales bacterium]|nr:hypothetical protein [Phycisphaerales bacterium]
MESKKETERITITLPPGWHAAMQEIADATGVSLKYLYSLAVDRFLGERDVEGVDKDAWALLQDMRKDLKGVASKHKKEALQKRYKPIKERSRRDSKRQRKT